MAQRDCPHCHEPLADDRCGPNEFCLSCDAWLHPDCVAPHAAVRPTPDGEWLHTDDREEP
jgi:hypothetical protein